MSFLVLNEHPTCTEMPRDSITRTSSLDSKLTTSSLSSGAASSNSPIGHSAAAGDGQFETLLQMKLALAVSRREMDNSSSSEEQAHYRKFVHKNQANMILLAHCDQAKSPALALLKGNNYATSARASQIPGKTKK